MNKQITQLLFICILFMFAITSYYVLNIEKIASSTKHLGIFNLLSSNDSDVNRKQVDLFETTINTTTTTTSIAITTTTSREDNLNKLFTFDKLINQYCPPETLNIAYECIKQLNKFKIDPDKYKSEMEIVYFHTFWKVNEGTHHEKVLILQILSFLATQEITKARFIVWLETPFSESLKQKLNKKFSFYLNSKIFEYRVLNITDLCLTGIFKKRFNDCVNTKNFNSVGFSDFIRFLVLNKYGGIYTDGDVFYLRDMRPFWMKDFVHRWSFTHNYNTAIMGMKINRSKTIEMLYDRILSKNGDLVNLFYPTRVKDELVAINNGSLYKFNDFIVYHSALFDPAWLCNDGILGRYDNKIVCVFREFYDTEITEAEFSVEKFYGGAFTFHLHLGNCGKCTVTPTTFFHHFENYFINKIPNIGN